MHVSERGLEFIAGFEGFSSTVYWDSLGHVYTRGFGETEGIGPRSPAITRAQGMANLRHRLERFYEPSIRALGVPFNQNQFDALCSFAWNLGAGIFTGSLRRSLQHHDARPLLAYDHAGGQVVAGLERRRRAEVSLFGARVANPLAVLMPAEHRLVNTYDRYIAHPRLHRHGLAVTRVALVRARKRVWLAAHMEIRHGKAPARAWAYRRRGVRYAILLSRTRGLG